MVSLITLAITTRLIKLIQLLAAFGGGNVPVVQRLEVAA